MHPMQPTVYILCVLKTALCLTLSKFLSYPCTVLVNSRLMSRLHELFCLGHFNSKHLFALSYLVKLGLIFNELLYTPLSGPSLFGSLFSITVSQDLWFEGTLLHVL
jgi:hypothetical protein